LTGCALGGALTVGGNHAWGFLAFCAFYALGDSALVVLNTRRLLGTLPSDRGKRSDDRALATAQRSWGCLPLLFIGSLVLGWIGFPWPTGTHVVFLSVLLLGLLGHAVAVGIIAWARRMTPGHE
jgi:hypothetical protein